MTTDTDAPTNRGYSLGLPVTIEVRPDGQVHAYVDLSDAGRRRDLLESQNGLEDDDVIPDEQILADAETIDAAVTAGTVTLHDMWQQPRTREHAVVVSYTAFCHCKTDPPEDLLDEHDRCTVCGTQWVAQ